MIDELDTAGLEATRRAAERTARASYGRLVAFLAARSGDIAAAEDALADAFAAALETWPRRGVPAAPEAWLLTAARRRLIGAARHAKVAATAAPDLVLDAAANDRDGDAGFPDDRLKLLFVCAHPAIDAAARAPLMLQTVFGFDAARIAPAFLMAPSAMAQRLVRAKTKIRDAGIAFAVPESRELAARLDGVLEAIYAAYGSAWDDVAGADPRRHGLAEETIWLASLTAWLLPKEAEALGLVALLLYCEARREARRTDAAFVPLSDQDPTRWSRSMIDQAEHALAAAARLNRPGRFQLEAAIQSAHVARRCTGHPSWSEIALLYEGLVQEAPTMGALVGRAAAVAEAEGVATGLALLDRINRSDVDAYQPYWALRAHLLARAGERGAARTAFDRAIGLAEDPAVRAWLTRRRDEDAA